MYQNWICVAVSQWSGTQNKKVILSPEPKHQYLQEVTSKLLLFWLPSYLEFNRSYELDDLNTFQNKETRTFKLA